MRVVSSGAEVLAMRRIARSVVVTDQVRRFAIRLVMATQPGSPHAAPGISDAVSPGSSPRGAQALLLLGKVRALLDERFAVSCQDVRDVAAPALRHRLLLSFEGRAEGADPDRLIAAAVESLRELSG